MSEAGFGRRVPETWTHVERFPLSAAPDREIFRRTPVILGINWYSNFDSPVRDETGRWWIGRGPLGRIEGGHAILADNGQLPDREAWYWFYNQGGLGACVGFSFERGMTQFYKTLFDAVWLWNRAKEVDEWPDTNPGDNEGTSLDAAARILFSQGSVLFNRRSDGEPDSRYGISEYRWATTADEVADSLQSSIVGVLEAVPLLNSWGEEFPRVVWLPLATLDRLLSEYGEACVLTRK